MAEKSLKARARNNVEKGNARLKRWWSEKYKLPANHDLFVNQSEAQLMLEYYEDLYARKQDIEKDLESNESDRSLLSQLNAIGKALGEEDMEKDDLWDKWERELEAGLIPDLNEGLNG